MSKFNQIKIIFEKEKEKKQSLTFKTSATTRNKPAPKQKTPPKKLHQHKIHNVNNEEKILLVGKVVPTNAATNKIPPSDKDRKEKDE